MARHWRFTARYPLLLGVLALLVGCAAPALRPAATAGDAAAQESSARGPQAPSVEAPAGGEQPVAAADAAVPAPAIGLAAGLHAPSFTVTGLDGRSISHADLRAEGKPSILYFYATW